MEGKTQLEPVARVPRELRRRPPNASEAPAARSGQTAEAGQSVALAVVEVGDARPLRVERPRVGAGALSGLAGGLSSLVGGISGFASWAFAPSSTLGEEWFSPYSSTVRLYREICEYFYLRRLLKHTRANVAVMETKFLPSLQTAKVRVENEVAQYDQAFALAKSQYLGGELRAARQAQRRLAHRAWRIEQYNVQIQFAEELISQIFLSSNAEMLQSGFIEMGRASTALNLERFFDRSERLVLEQSMQTAKLIQRFDRFNHRAVSEGEDFRMLTSDGVGAGAETDLGAFFGAEVK